MLNDRIGFNSACKQECLNTPWNKRNDFSNLFITDWSWPRGHFSNKTQCPRTGINSHLGFFAIGDAADFDFRAHRRFIRELVLAPTVTQIVGRLKARAVYAASSVRIPVRETGY